MQILAQSVQEWWKGAKYSELLVKDKSILKIVTMDLRVTRQNQVANAGRLSIAMCSITQSHSKPLHLSITIYCCILQLVRFVVQLEWE